MDDPIAVVVITTFDLDEYVHDALRPVPRFSSQDAEPELLVQAMHAAARGDALIAPSVTARLLETFAGDAVRSATPAPLEALSPVRRRSFRCRSWPHQL